MILVKATKAHLIQAAGNLSRHDLDEFHMHQSNRNPLDVLPNCLDDTTMAIVEGSIVLAVGGSNDCLWFVTTTYVERLPMRDKLTFFRLLKGHLEDVKDHKAFSTPLTNFVSVVNTPHIRLLNALRASWSNVITMSPAGFAFRQFWL
uniref:Internal virion protein A n=1 Tax=Pseudomonas phage Ghual01 TaxID=3138534 RepID=A0AAU6VZN7_9CAUD